MNFSNVFDMLNLGVVILDQEYRIVYWNNWMGMHSEIPAEEVVGRDIFEAFPEIDTPVVRRSFKSVFAFGSFYFFSQKLHDYLFPIRTFSSFDTNYEFMQQSCTFSPLREGEGPEVTHICITVQDVTEIAAYEQVLIQQNLRDSLTNAFNHRFFTMRLAEEVERQHRYGGHLSVMLIDIDHFKEVNDTYGHVCGDFILKSVSDSIQTSIRKMDVMARYGGEEFCCIMPETETVHAAVLAERIRGTIAEEEYVYEGHPIRVTVSIGVSGTVEGKVSTPDSLLKNADAGMYKAKKSGRNSVVSFT